MNGNLGAQYQRPASADSYGPAIPMAEPGTTFNPQDRLMYESFRTGGRAIPQSLARYNSGSSTAKPQVNAQISPVGVRRSNFDLAA